MQTLGIKSIAKGCANLRSLLFVFFFAASFIFLSCGEKKPKDLEAISDMLLELENLNYFPEDIYFRLPPPFYFDDSISTHKFDSINLNELLTNELMDSYNKQLREIENRKVDSTFIFLMSEDYLFNSCDICSIRPDSLLQNLAYLKFLPLVDRLVKGNLEPLLIDYYSFPQKGKYKLKSNSKFPDRTQLYNNQLDFLCGGEISISRFYHEKDIGVIYFDTTICPSDCGVGYLVLMEYRTNKWKIFDILIQHIS
ncbi:hypothetical protein [Aquiflexum gelatinilyticum]|uniref:hypothetical protein n=1 Tax=Aquiflexum gelatinilyticum TaxID=2961943 RepID=UPI002169F30C|nr:hypothetical protein [Aquiflexum gelatinilyticum]MCS4436559.1 hypothetical protein [Aquiflexum gelatinilyticum]